MTSILNAPPDDVRGVGGSFFGSIVRAFVSLGHLILSLFRSVKEYAFGLLLAGWAVIVSLWDSFTAWAKQLTDEILAEAFQFIHTVVGESFDITPLVDGIAFLKPIFPFETLFICIAGYLGVVTVCFTYRLVKSWIPLVNG